MSDNPQAEMPKYRCTKDVWALKIKDIVENPNESLDVFFEDDGFANLNMSKDELSNKPNPSIGDYYVRYKDGYSSFSPPKAFDEGYVRIGQ